MSIPKANKKHTYADYLTWPGEERWEIIDGTPLLQSAPTWQHQAISGELFRQFSNHLAGKPCHIFSAPFDLRLPLAAEADQDATYVLQPDLTVSCDKAGPKGTGYFGVPELVVEVSSSSTGKFDKVSKFNAYEKAGVREYWIAEPEQKVVSVFKLQDGRYGRPAAYTEEDTVCVGSFPDLAIELKRVFADF